MMCRIITPHIILFRMMAPPDAMAEEYNTIVNRETVASSWLTMLSLLQCPASCGQESAILMQDTDRIGASCGPRSCFPWLRNLQCSNCCERWSVCIECEGVRKPINTREQVRRHNARKHFKIPSATTDELSPNESNKRPRGVNEDDNELMNESTRRRTIPDGGANGQVGDTDTTDFVVNEDILDDDNLLFRDGEAGVVRDAAVAEAVTFPFDGDRNTKYFTNDHQGLGVAYLVSQSQFGMDFLSDKLLKEDLSFQLHLASLISGMSRGQQKDFAMVMRKYHQVTAMKSEEASKQLLATASAASSEMNASLDNHIEHDGGPRMGSPSQCFTRMPDSYPDMRHLYLEGRTSFLPNLPRPNVIRLQRHAYVSVIDCIADISQGRPLDYVCPTFPRCTL